MASQIDTSGSVLVQRATSGGPFEVRWSDLNPFTQGFIEAALLGTAPDDLEVRGSEDTYRQAGFSDLAPETLARFMEDCERFAHVIGDPRPPIHNAGIGERFWKARQLGFTTYWSLHQAELRGPFPPLRLYLADDGKVRIKEAASLSTKEG